VPEIGRRLALLLPRSGVSHWVSRRGWVFFHVARGVGMTHLGAAVSRRAALRVLASGGSALALEGCAALSANAPRFDAAELTSNQTLLVATNRKPTNGARAQPWFGPERASRTTIARARLAPPDESRTPKASRARVEPYPSVFTVGSYMIGLQRQLRAP
jgi:hypothetical protein